MNAAPSPSARVAHFKTFALAVLGFTLAVILWGAYVRATGSGAGCGSHWPTCNGEVIPRPKSLATVIEVTHRLTSGLSFLFVLAQFFASRRVFDRGHPARRATAWGLLFMVTEALLGAGLVLFEHVAQDKSVARAAWVALHLTNTSLLVVALTAVALLSEDAPLPLRLRGELGRGFLGLRSTAWWGTAALGGFLLVGVSGAIAALGDTLFPVSSLAEGLAQDFSPSAHLFVRLRAWHPLLASSLAVGLLQLGSRIASTAVPGPGSLRSLALVLSGLVLLQVGCGVSNVALLAPVPLQLLHLFLADAVLVVLVWLWGRALQGAQASQVA